MSSFYFTIDQHETRIYDDKKSWYKWAGNGFTSFVFKDLAAGTYNLRIGGLGSKPKVTGDMPFAVVGYASK